ncbi:MAG: hypothetical protein FD159_2765 [Syntrophaceae bacterium]|nr:MAG: hypothetical protein FD159_2765 [Syntrophaceae bacterium]
MSTFLTAGQAAEFLGIKPSYLRKLCHQRKVPHFKPNNGKVLFDAGELEAFVRAGRVATHDELAVHADTYLKGGAI